MDGIIKFALIGLIAYVGYEVFLQIYGPAMVQSLNQGGNYAGTGFGPLPLGVSNQSSPLVAASLASPTMTNSQALAAMMVAG